MTRALGLALVLGACAAPVAAQASGPPKSSKSSKSDRTWVRHEIIPGDRLDTIADRYGVTRSALIRWNKLDPKKAVIRVGKKLKVYARHVPPPRELISYEIKKGDTWGKIAAAHDVQEKHLRRWNKKVPRAFKYGTELRIWVEGEDPEAAGGDAGSSKAGASGNKKLPTVKVGRNGYSVGRPNRGRLVNGVQLPENEALYTRRNPDTLYGTSHTIRLLQDSIAIWRRDSNYSGKLVVSAISKKAGGRFRPHSSHQTGRDIDIRLPARAGVGHTLPQNMGEVDWNATWGLVQALLETGEIQYIFLETSRQKKLYAAAKRAGVSKKQLEAWIQYPNRAKTNNGVVRHAAGHTAHIHVRFTCGKNESRCESY